MDGPTKASPGQLPRSNVAANNDVYRISSRAFIELIKEANRNCGITIEATLSQKQFNRIQPLLDGDSRWSYTAFNNLFTMNKPLSGPHGVVKFPIQQAIEAAVLENGGGNVYDNFLFLGKSRIIGFTGVHEGTEKEPDDCIFKFNPGQGIHYDKNNVNDNLFPRLVLEVDCSDTWDKLHSDAAVWLEGSRGAVRVVILIQIKESEDRVNPLVLREDGELVETPPPKYQYTPPADQSESCFHPLSPRIYKGFAITGSTKLSVEVWRPASQEDKERGDYTPKCSYRATLADANPNAGADIKDYISLRKSDFDLVPEGGEDGELRLEVGRHGLVEAVGGGLMLLANFRVARAMMEAKGVVILSRLEKVIVEPDDAEKKL